MRQLVAAAVLLTFAAAVVDAQAHRASMRGIVTDAAGQRLSAVEVRVMNERTGEARGVRTDHDGRYTVLELPPGVYRLAIDLAGYGRFIARTELAMNQDYWLNVGLQKGNLIQAVDIVTPFLPSDHDTPALHTFITDRDLNEWPLERGSFLELALLAPQTAAAPQGSPTSRHGRFATNVTGVRDSFNNFIIDGLYNVDPGSNTPAVRPPSDAIRQFQVFTSNYDASFGRSAGAQISAVTKSGTNTFSGSIYGFARGTALGGRNHFAPKEGSPPDYARNQAGGTIGGPIVRNRTFFFADYERTHLREGITRVATVPTAAERSGDFSRSAIKPIDFVTGQRFPGDVIPAIRMTDFGRATAALYPAPNRDAPFSNYVSSPVMRDDINQADTRIDQALGTRALITGRYSVMDRALFEPFGGEGSALVPGFGTRIPVTTQNTGVTLTHAPSSAWLNDLRLGYTRVSQRTIGESDTGLPLLDITGYSPLGRDGEPRSTTGAFQVSDTVMFSHGHHTVRAGGEWYAAERRTPAEPGPRRFLTLPGQNPASNGLASLLLGFPPMPGRVPMRYPPTLRTKTAAAFVQNDWRPLSTFSLSAGLRYEYAVPPYDPQNVATLYDPSSGRLVPAGGGGMPRGGYLADSNNIAPRIGFAWTVGADRMNVIRGAYGVYYTAPTLAFSALQAPEPPHILGDVFPALTLVFIPPSVVGYQRDLQTPRMDTWNLDFQHQLGQSRSFEFAYVGSRGSNLLAARDINQPVASGRRPNPRPEGLFADIAMLESRATSEYNGLHIRFQQRPAAGTAMIVSYTIGKSLDDASGFLPTAGDPNFPQNSLDPGAERARSSFDIRHRFTAGITRPLPFNDGQFLGRLGIVSRVLADSDLVAVATFQSGRPFTVAILPGIDNSNTGSSRFGFGANDRPNVDGSAALPQGTESAWFKTSAFSMPAFGTFGNSGRNSQTGPGYKSLDAGIVKHIRLGTRDRATIDVRVEAFNLLGTVNYHLPDMFFGSPTFGRILSAGSPRRVQLGIKASF